jgi:hypothetical protein
MEGIEEAEAHHGDDPSSIRQPAIDQADDCPSSRDRMDRTPFKCPRCHEHHTGSPLDAGVQVLSVTLRHKGLMETKPTGRHG